MFSKLWIINMVIAGIAAFLGVNAIREWSGKDTAVPVVEPASSGPAEKAKPVMPKVAQPASRTIPPQEAFNVVVEKNLFASEREELKEEVKPPPAPASPPKQEKKEPEPAKWTFTLYGVMITKSYKGALLSFSEDQAQKRKPHPSQSQPAGPRWYETGEGEGDWKIASIEKEKVLISVGGASTEVLLYDKEKPKQRTVMAVKSQGPTVVTIATQAPGQTKAMVVGEKGTEKEAGTEQSQRVEEKRVSETKKQPGSISSRLGTGLSTRTSREGSTESSSYSTSRTPTFMRSR